MNNDAPSHSETNTPYDNPAFRNVLRKIVATPKEEVERGLAAQKLKRINKRKPRTKPA
jgi:hypothetical protein